MHMSFYSVIDDTFDISVYTIVSQTLKNWVAIIAIIYVIIVLVGGIIISYTKDNTDY